MFLFLCFVEIFQKIRLAAAAVEFPLFWGGLKLFAFTYSGFVCNFFVSFRLAAPASRRYADLRLPFFPTLPSQVGKNNDLRPPQVGKPENFKKLPWFGRDHVARISSGFS